MLFFRAKLAHGTRCLGHRHRIDGAHGLPSFFFGKLSSTRKTYHWSLVRTFSSSSKIDFKRSWDSLPAAQKQAWELLGVEGEQTWKCLSKQDGGSVKLVKLKRFDHLSNAQQAAVIHGLALDAANWDAFVDHLQVELQTAAETPRSDIVDKQADAAQSGMPSSLVSTAWRFTKRYGPAVGALLNEGSGRGAAKGRGGLVAAVAGQLLEMLPWMVDLKEGPVQVEDLETVLYLDDSGSMNGANLSEARGALRKMAHLLQDSPTRVCTFGTHKQVILPRESSGSRPRSSSTAVAVPDENAPQYFSQNFEKLSPDIIGLQWKGRSPGTYMWHMILEDIREKYIPGNGKLRAIVITDGLDTHSPSPYRGIQGMNPMMQQLLEDGFDIEWHIVVVSVSNLFGRAISKGDIDRYEALAEATGGGFLHIDEPGVMNDYDARHFLSSLEKAVTGGDASFLDTAKFTDQQGKGARFLSRLHQSNRHLEDQVADATRRQKQLEQWSHRSQSQSLPWLPLLESSRKGKK